MDEPLKKKLVYTYDAAPKKREIWSHIITLVNPEDIMLSEIAGHKRDKHCVIALI